jgi:hypothetical protein
MRIPLIAALFMCSCAATGGEPDWIFPRSSVVNLATLGPDYEEYANFGTNVVAWGSEISYVSDSWLLGHLNAARATGHLLWYSTNTAVATATARVLYEQPPLQDAVLRDLDFQPIVVPWFSTRFHEGIPTWAGCTNHPLYQDHIEGKLRHGLTLGFDAMHLDTPEGSNRISWGGCFCDYCISAFRPFLTEHASPEELAGLGPIDSFNYRTYLRGSYTTEQFVSAYQSNPESIPLIRHYVRFQQEAFATLVDDIHETLESEFATLIPLSTNVYDLRPESVDVIGVSDFLTAEVNYYGGSSEQPKPFTRFALKLSTAMGKRFCTTATAWDWGSVRDNDNMTVIGIWVGLTYALGHHFVIPYNQWVFSNGQQENQLYTPDPSVTRPLYQYVHQKAAQLDDMEDAAEVALVIDIDNYAEAGSPTASDAYKLFNALIGKGYSVQLVTTSSGRFPSIIETRILPEADLILVSANVDTSLDAELEQWITDSVDAGSELQEGLVLGAVNQLNHTPRQSIETGSGVILPRRNTSSPTEHRVYHILNTLYDVNSQTVTLQNDMVVRFRPSDNFFQRDWLIRWHEQGQTPIELPFTYSFEYIEVALPRLGTWGMLEVIESGPNTERFPITLAPFPGNATATLEFPSTSGRSYRIMTSTDLKTWSQHGDDLEGTDAMTAEIVPVGSSTFYQIFSMDNSGTGSQLNYVTEYFDGTADPDWFGPGNTLDGYGPDNEAPKDVGTFYWGGYAAGVQDANSNKVIATSLWDSGGVLSIRFSALVPGTYAYTAFDNNGAYDASGEGAGIVVEQFAGKLNGGTATFAVLLYDGTDWWQSDTRSVVDLSWGAGSLQDHEFRFTGAAAVSWKRLSNAENLALMDSGGEQALTESLSGTPDLSQVQGMGLIVVQNEGASQLDFSRMELQY